MFHKISIVVVLYCFSSCAKEIKIEETYQSDLIEILQSLDKKNKYVEDELVSLNNQAGVFDFATSVEAVLKLWSLESSVDLYWWEKDERVVRTLIVALYYSGVSNERVAYLPNFIEYSKRFKDHEEKKRIQEIFFVKKHKKKFAKLFSSILAKMGMRVDSGWFLRYKQQAVKETE